jgi:large subunit ribosomal protein L25
MATGVKISAEPRNDFGKGFARRTRRAGLVPAVIYGHGEAPRHISLPAKEFAAAIRHGGMTTVFDITVSDGHQTLALPKAIQRDPLKDTYRHVDLIIVKRGEMVTVEVPVHVVGEAVKGTMTLVEHDRIAVIAEALHLPEHVEASIEGLDQGAQRCHSSSSRTPRAPRSSRARPRWPRKAPRRRPRVPRARPRARAANPEPVGCP